MGSSKTRSTQRVGAMGCSSCRVAASAAWQHGAARLAVARRKVCGLPQGRVEQGLCSAFSLPRETSGKSFFPAAGGFISSSEVSCSGSAPLLPQVFAIGLNFRFGVFTHEVVPTLSIPGTPRQLPGFSPVGSPLGCVSLWLFLKNCRLPPPNCFRSPTQPRSMCALWSGLGRAPQTSPRSRWELLVVVGGKQRLCCQPIFPACPLVGPLWGLSAS